MYRCPVGCLTKCKNVEMWKCPAARSPEFKVNCNFYGKVLRNMNYIDHTLSDIWGSTRLSSGGSS